jgi:hypothetical protein
MKMAITACRELLLADPLADGIITTSKDSVGKRNLTQQCYDFTAE